MSVIVRIFFGCLAIVIWAIRFVMKKFLIAVPWIISAGVALTLGFYALGRQFFSGEDAQLFLERFLPPREFERETFSLTLIELMLVVREKIF